MLVQALIAASLVIATYQDFKMRAIEDRAWYPAIVGGGLAILFNFSSTAYLFKIGLLALVLAGIWYFASIGTADLIALTFLFLDPSPLSPLLPMVFFGAAIGIYLAYVYQSNLWPGRRLVTIENFNRHLYWIPYAIVSGQSRRELTDDVNVAREEALTKISQNEQIEVEYGLPDASFIGIGYLAFTVYQLLFAHAVLFALP